MRTTIVAAVAGGIIVAGAMLALRVGPASGVVYPVTPYEADVNKDRAVNSIDLMQVAQRFGQVVPTATPTATQASINTYIASVAYMDTWTGGGTCPTDCTNIFHVLCDAGDNVAGGGFSNTSEAATESVPVVVSGQQGWEIHAYGPNNLQRVWAICLDNPPLH